MTVYVFNTTIAPTPGLTYTTEVLDVEGARAYVAPCPGRAVVSAIGHDATAAIASEVLGQPITVNRIAAEMRPGDHAVCIKLRGRPPEGVVLSREEIEALGFELVLMTALDPRASYEAHRRREICLDLLALPDDGARSGVPAPGTRRRVHDSHQMHYVVRRPLSWGDGYVSVTQESGTDAWDWTEISADLAQRLTAGPVEAALTTLGADMRASAARHPLAEEVRTKIFGD